MPAVRPLNATPPATQMIHVDFNCSSCDIAQSTPPPRDPAERERTQRDKCKRRWFWSAACDDRFESRSRHVIESKCVCTVQGITELYGRKRICCVDVGKIQAGAARCAYGIWHVDEWASVEAQ